MQKRGPMITLAIVALIAVGLLTANALVGDTEDTGTQQAATTATAPGSTAPTTAPPESGFPTQADYAGQSGAIALSITVTGTQATAYACDGNTVESWLKGTAIDGKLELTNDQGDTFSGKLNGTTVTGVLKIGVRTSDFSASQVQPPAGIYRYSEGGSRYSWVLEAPNDSTGIQQLPDGSTQPAPPLDSDGTAVINGRTVQAQKVTADQ